MNANTTYNNSFTDWMKAQFSLEEMRDIANNGCDGGFHGLIHYSETHDLFMLHGDDILEIINDFEEGAGTDVLCIDRASVKALYNSLVWCAAELVAFDIVSAAEDKPE
jgi:hypothetical protein